MGVSKLLLKRETALFVIFLISAAFYLFYLLGVNFFVAAATVFLSATALYILFGFLLRYVVNDVRIGFRITLSMAAMLISCVVATILFAVTLLTTAYRLPGIPLVPVYLSAVKNICFVIGTYALVTLCFYSIGTVLDVLVHGDTATMLAKTMRKIGLGCAATILFFYAAAFAGQLRWTALIVYGVVVASIIVRDRKKYYRELFRPIGLFSFSRMYDSMAPFRTLLGIGIGLFVIFCFISLSGFHPIGGDDVRAYYNIPKTFVEQGRPVEFPYDAQNNGSLAFVYIYAPLLIISDSLVNYTSLYFFILLLITSYCFGRDLFGEKVGLLTVFLVASMPWNFVFLMSSKIDFMTAFFVVLSVFILLSGQKNEKLRTTALAGIFLGVAVAIKYTALLILPGLALVALTSLLAGERSIVKHSVVFLLWLCIGFSPWAVRNYVVWHNPVFPYTISGDYEGFKRLSSAERSLVEQFSSTILKDGHIMNKTNSWWVNIWYVAVNRTGYTFNRTGPLLLALLLLIGLVPADKRDRALLLVISASIVGTLVAWLVVVAAEVWYIMYIFPLLMVIYAYYLSRWKNKIQLATILAISLVLFFSSITTSRLFMVQFLYDKLTLEQYQSIFGPYVSLSRYLNTKLSNQDPNYVIFPMGDQQEILINDNYRHLYGTNFYLVGAIASIAETSTYEELAQYLRSRGITHIYYVKRDMDKFRKIWCNESVEERHCKEFDRLADRYNELFQHLVPTAQTDEWIVYKL